MKNDTHFFADSLWVGAILYYRYMFSIVSILVYMKYLAYAHKAVKQTYPKSTIRYLTHSKLGVNLDLPATNLKLGSLNESRETIWG